MQEQRKTFHVKEEDQKELASSRENSTPPAGAPKAAATPAAAPPAHKISFYIIASEYF